MVDLETLFRRSDLSFIKLGQWSIFRILFKKMLILSEFRIDLSRSFHSIITEGKKEFLI